MSDIIHTYHQNHKSKIKNKKIFQIQKCQKQIQQAVVCNQYYKSQLKDKMECKFNWQEDARQVKKGKKYKQYYTMTYPTDKIREMKFQSSEEISTFLLRNAMEIGYSKWQLFQKEIFDIGDCIKIVYTCRMQHCDAKLIYLQKKNNLISQPTTTQDEPSFTKKYFLAQYKIINRHQHILFLSSQILAQSNIRQYLNDLPVQQKFENHVQTIKQKFNLKISQAKHLRNRLFWKFKNEDHMLQKLTQRKIVFRRKVVKQKSTILLLASEPMRKNYNLYGDNLCFDITYKILKKKTTEDRHLGVGFFVGQDQNSRIVIFAMCTIVHQTTQYFQILFEFFFDIMKGRIPETILTDDQMAIGCALRKLKQEKKYTYVHLLDWFHKMEAVKRVVKREGNGQELFVLFCRLLKQPSKQVYYDIASQIATLLQKKQKMLNFLSGQDQYCLCKVPAKFFSFGISSTRAEAFNALIKRSVPHQTNFGKLIYFVLRVEKRLLNRMAVFNYINSHLTKHINDEEILMLAQKLETLAFEQIRQYYEQSRTFQTILPGKSILHKSIPFFKYQRPYHVNLFFDLKYNCWRCQCTNNFRTGMPCSHLMRIIREYKGSVSYYINERWFHNKENAVIKKSSRPSTKNKKI